MTNKVYLTPSLNEALPSLDLSAEQVKNLDAAISSLGESEALESRIVLADGTPGGGLRELDRNGFRIFFRLDPKNGTVIVADIRSKTYAAATSPHPKEEMAAAS